MKPQQLGNLLGVAPTTLRRWAREYSEFLSLSGRGRDGAYRTYNEHDARIMAWITALRAENTAPADIVGMLRIAQANNWRDLPPLPGGLDSGEPVAVIPREAAEERLSAIRDRYEMELQSLRRERDEMREQMAGLRSENAELRQQQQALNERILALNERLMSMLEKEQRRRK